jgi:hypothetical protein
MTTDKDVTLIIKESDINLLQELFYTTITKEDHQRVRRGERHPTEESNVTWVDPDGTRREMGKRRLLMDDVVNPHWRELWLRMDEQFQQQCPFTVL